MTLHVAGCRTVDTEHSGICRDATGKPRVILPSRFDTLADRLWRRVIKQDDGCWVWTGAAACGYGRIGLGARGAGSERTHRVAYELLVGPIPAGLTLDHLCRVTLCCNPEHLEPVTRAENARRQAAAYREANPTCPSGHEFTEENTYRWVGKGSRQCRTCMRASATRSNARRAEARA